MYIQHVKSNLKRGVDATLGKRTIITGPNGSGKTSIQNAIELALTGSASDIEGRAVVRKGDMLAKLGPPGEGVTTVATLEDGRAARWSITPNRKGGYFEPSHQPLGGVRVVFPVQEVREVLTGSPDSLRMWLMSRVGANATLQDVLNGLAAKHVGLYKDRAGRVRRGGLTSTPRTQKRGRSRQKQRLRSPSLRRYQKVSARSRTRRTSRTRISQEKKRCVRSKRRSLDLRRRLCR